MAAERRHSPKAALGKTSGSAAGLLVVARALGSAVSEGPRACLLRLHARPSASTCWRRLSPLLCNGRPVGVQVWYSATPLQESLGPQWALALSPCCRKAMMTESTCVWFLVCSTNSSSTCCMGNAENARW